MKPTFGWIAVPQGGSGAKPQPPPMDPRRKLWVCLGYHRVTYKGEQPPADMVCQVCVEIQERESARRRIERFRSLRRWVRLRRWLAWLMGFFWF